MAGFELGGLKLNILTWVEISAISATAKKLAVIIWNMIEKNSRTLRLHSI